MKRITATLLTDGSSDRLLVPLIEMLLSEHTDSAYQVVCAQGLPPAASGLQARIAAALKLFPCDLLLVHRDDEGVGSEAREREIESHWERTERSATLVCVIPVRMTEAWLIASEAPIRAAVCNPHGKEALGLPPIKNIESAPDPKAILFHALTEATGYNAHRKKKFNPHQYRHRVSELMDDLTPIRKLASFRHLESQLSHRLGLLEAQKP
jgi:hypothetical protein